MFAPSNENKYTGTIRKNVFPEAVTVENKEVQHLPRNFKDVIETINKGFRVCIVLRGLPGSGKSFLAHQILNQTKDTLNPNEHILSADNFFMRNGQYIYDSTRIQEAHSETHSLFAQRASKGVSPLIIDNTNVEYWNMLFYFQVAIQYNYTVEIMEPATPWKTHGKSLAVKNIHSVPLESIKRMKRNYECGVGLRELLKSYGLEPSTPKMRNIPPLKKSDEPKQVDFKVPTKEELLEFNPLNSEEMNLINFNKLPKVDDILPKIDFSFVQAPLNAMKEATVVLPPGIEGFLNALNEKCESKMANETEIKDKKEESLLLPHRKNCPNENENFVMLREFYPLNEAYLWDYFARCNGDIEWCANLLYEDNLENSGNNSARSEQQLTCSCDSDGMKTEVKPQPKVEVKKSSPNKKKPSIKQKKNKQDSNVDGLQMKEAIENSIKIAPEHYPEHVKVVKNWKQPLSENVVNAEQQTPEIFPSHDVSDELQRLTISNELLTELDEEYGGGMLRAQQKKLPSKVFIKKSTALQLYLEIVEAYYSHEEETKLQLIKDDEELAKKMSEQERFLDKSNKWKDDKDDDDFSVKMSKEKLVKLFPGINCLDLMEIFKSCQYNFQETVERLKDSLYCSPQERSVIDEAQKKIFNETWQVKDQEKQVKDASPVEEFDGCAKEQLKTVEDLRQDIEDHMEEQKICFFKAKEAIEKKNYELASYLSNIAKFHKMKADDAKHEVANLIAEIHGKTHASKTIVDLHYLSSIEASVLLDEFLDRNISRLRDTRKPYDDLFIITGRGKHSKNGVATIKNKTKQILSGRNLSSTETNPGFLKVKIFQRSLLSKEM